MVVVGDPADAEGVVVDPVAAEPVAPPDEPDSPPPPPEPCGVVVRAVVVEGWVPPLDAAVPPPAEAEFPVVLGDPEDVDDEDPEEDP